MGKWGALVPLPTAAVTEESQPPLPQSPTGLRIPSYPRQPNSSSRLARQGAPRGQQFCLFSSKHVPRTWPRVVPGPWSGLQTCMLNKRTKQNGRAGGSLLPSLPKTVVSIPLGSKMAFRGAQAQTGPSRQRNPALSYGAWKVACP